MINKIYIDDNKPIPRTVTESEIQYCIKKTKAFIKQLRQSAKEQNHRADELAKSNSVLMKRIKR